MNTKKIVRINIAEKATIFTIEEGRFSFMYENNYWPTVLIVHPKNWDELVQCMNNLLGMKVSGFTGDSFTITNITVLRIIRDSNMAENECEFH